jgi:hypothetical protein
MHRTAISGRVMQMWGHEALAGLDSILGTMTVPIWAAGAAAALLVVLYVAAFARAGGVVGTGLRAALILVGTVAVAFLLFERGATREAAAERRALEGRLAELTARAVAPGSPLACLDGWGGEAVEAACEKLVFATPETLSAAVSYVAARLALLARAVDLAPRQGPESPTLEGLRLAAESDRFGLVSHVLATRDGCTAEACVQLAMLRNPERVTDNLKAHAFEAVVARHAQEWGVAPAVAAAPPSAAPAPVPTVASSASANAPFFPSAASIPPISIMNAEPTAPPAPAPAQATAEPRRTTPLPPRRPPQQQQGQAPIQLAPATTGAEPRAQ